MKILANNGKQIVLDEQLNEYTAQSVTPNFVIYQQFLNLLHLPAEKWEYSKTNKGKVFIQETPEMEELNRVDFRRYEISDFALPLRLYTYFLLQSFLGNGEHFGGVGLLPGKKMRMVFLDTHFSHEKMGESSFEMNQIGRLTLKPARKKDLLNVHEAFFVLMNKKIKPRLMNALILYQTETGQDLNKLRLLEPLLDQSRLDRLNVFSIKQIARL